MDSFDSHSSGGSLQISTEVIEKIASHAALEVDGVCEVAPPVSGAKAVWGRLTQPKSVQVELKDDVADISVSIVVAYGAKIPEISERVQQNVKDSIQNMTSISVARVDVIIVGLSVESVQDKQQ